MTTSDYALLVSLASMAISMVALLWNVLQKFIFVKPNLQVVFGIYNLMQPLSTEEAIPSGQRLLLLTVTNMGPGTVMLYACVAKIKPHWWKRAEYGTINPIHGDPKDQSAISIGPFSSGLPTKIDAGDMKGFCFPYSKECFLNEGGLVSVGINDTYGRYTWCRRRDMRKAHRAYNQEFINGVGKQADDSTGFIFVGAKGD